MDLMWNTLFVGTWNLTICWSPTKDTSNWPTLVFLKLSWIEVQKPILWHEKPADGHVTKWQYHSCCPLLSVTELNLSDILTTPSLAKPDKHYSRTPGQVLSLICSLGFVSNTKVFLSHTSVNVCLQIDRYIGRPIFAFYVYRYRPIRGWFSPFYFLFFYLFYLTCF